MKLLLRTMVVLLVLCLALPLGTAQAAMPPYAPQYFSGEVTIGGILAPDETTVSAWIDDIWYASTTPSDGEYLLKVPGHDPAEPVKQGGEPGDIVVFKVNDIPAESDPAGPVIFDPWSDEVPTPLDLAIAGTPPVAEFTSNVQTGDEPLTVDFTDESLNMEEGPTWSWDFGDGGIDTAASPSHQFFYDGSYTVTLTVTTAYGSDTEVKTDYIVVADTGPTASFTADPTSGDYPLEVSFTDTSSSYDGIITYQWDFSYDGVTFNVESTEQNPSLVYQMEGTYSVVLRVIEDDGDSIMMVAENLITVGVPLPVAQFSASPVSGDEPLTVDFTDESQNMINNPTWSWEFGDGGISTEPSPTYQYIGDHWQGSYTVRLTVTTDDGTDTEIKTNYIVVADTEPVAGFIAGPTSGDRPLEVSFTDQSTSYDGIITWEWDFGDGGTSTEQNPTYTYEDEGTYTVALMVTEADEDSDGLVAMELITVTVPGDTTDPVIEYAGVEYYIGAESARPGDQFEVAAVVTDDTWLSLVEVDTPFGIFELLGEEYEGITIFWVVIDVPEDTTPGTYELHLRAEDAAGNEATQTLELEVTLDLESYNVLLADGWNLISLPLIPDVTDAQIVLDGFSFLSEDVVREVWGADAADLMMPILESVWYYDAAGEYGPAGVWLFFEPDAPEIIDLPEMEDGKGYWVEVVAVAYEEGLGPPPILTVYGVELVSGPTLPPEYAVVEGWNLIGFKETRGMHFSEYLSAVEGKYARIHVYDAYGQCFYTVGEGGTEYMQPGAGYWIYMTEDGYIVP